MKTREARSEKAASVLGTVMMLSWAVIVGIGGFFMLMGIFYGMSSANNTLLAVCSFGLFIPVSLTLLWGMFMIEETVREWVARKSANGTVGTPLAMEDVSG